MNIKINAAARLKATECMGETEIDADGSSAPPKAPIHPKDRKFKNGEGWVKRGPQEKPRKASVVKAMSNSQGGVMAEVSDALRKAKYEVKTTGASSLTVSNGTIANVAALLKNRGWTLNSSRTELHHSQIDYYIKLSEAKGVTTLRIVD